jgi:dihydrofolate reductase
MRKLSVFNFITLNGFYKDADGGISWHQHGAEESQFSAESMKAGNTLLFGRVTYEMMAGFWPTPMAMQHDPATARGMNAAEKIVFSRSLKKADWSNTTIVSGDLIGEVKKMKQKEGNNMTILGSGSIVSQLADAGLIDEYQIMVDPIAIGDGTPIFSGIQKQLNLKLTATRTFKTGVVLLSYVPQ